MTDTTLPTLTSIRLPSSLDVTGGAVTSTIAVGATDDTAVDHVTLTFDKPLGSVGSTITFSAANDSFSDGYSLQSFSFPSNILSGTYTVQGATVVDTSGNTHVYDASSLAQIGAASSIAISGAAYVPPPALALTGLSIPSVVSLQNGLTNVSASATLGPNNENQAFYVTMTLDSGLLPGSFGYYDLGGTYHPSQLSQYIGLSRFGSGTVDNRVGIGTDPSYPTPTVGVHHITSLELRDSSGDTVTYTDAQLTAMGFATDITVTDQKLAPPPIEVIAPSWVRESAGSFAIALQADYGYGPGSVQVSYDSTSKAVNGLDVGVVPGTASFSSEVQATAQDDIYTITPFTIYGDKMPEENKGIDITLSLSDGHTFVGGSTTQTVHIDLLDDDDHGGRSDIVWFNQDQHTITIWGPDQSGFEANRDIITNVAAGSQVIGQSDVNHDGRADVLIRSADGTINAYDDQGTAFSLNPNFTANVDPSWKVVALANDGTIAWRNGGHFTVWESDGKSWVPNVINDDSVSADWTVVGSGDFAGKGALDLLWRNTSTGAFTEWQGSKLTVFSSTPYLRFDENTYVNDTVGKDWHMVATGDFNGDGKDDIVWRNDNGHFTIWSSNGSGFDPNSYVNDTVSNDWQIVKVADFNNDGYADLLFRNTQTGTFTEWTGDGHGGFNQNVVVDSSVSTAWQLTSQPHDIV